MELNPGFDGKVLPRVVSGVVRGFSFLTDNIMDISSVRGLEGLETLAARVVGQARLSDLSALKGLKLTSLYFMSGKVSDLSPLKGMPLTFLSCIYTQVADLRPLGRMPLTNLQCHHTPVADVSPLYNCPSLEKLDIESTQVTPAGVAALQKALPNCKITWDDPAKSGTKQPWNTPAFQVWMNSVVAMPAVKQVDAVSKKLMELNPGFDGKLSPEIGGTGCRNGNTVFH